MATDRLAWASAFLRARLSPEGYLGLHLTVGVLLLAAAGWVFGNIAEDVLTTETFALDLAIAQWFHAHAFPALTTFMLWISRIHGTIGIIVLTVLAGLVPVWKKEWYWLLGLVVSVAGGMLMNVLVKYAFHRARPSFDDPLLTLTTYSFPSGHTAGSMLFYGVVTAYLVAHTRSLHCRASVVAVAVLMVTLVGVSRMYLGVHYFSDVLAAVAESIAWLAISLTAISTLRRRHEARSLTE